MECEWEGCLQLPSLTHRNALGWVSALPSPIFTCLHPALCLRGLTARGFIDETLDSGWVKSVGVTCRRLEGGRKVRAGYLLAPSCAVALSWLLASTKASVRHPSPHSCFSLPVPLTITFACLFRSGVVIAPTINHLKVMEIL